MLNANLLLSVRARFSDGIKSDFSDRLSARRNGPELSDEDISSRYYQDVIKPDIDRLSARAQLVVEMFDALPTDAVTLENSLSRLNQMLDITITCDALMSAIAAFSDGADGSSGAMAEILSKVVPSMIEMSAAIGELQAEVHRRINVLQEDVNDLDDA